jgi:E3 ubiquitin-protein ligase UBR1
MRAQQLHYREYSTRENTFDQDVYLMQLAFAVVDPSDLLLTMLDRFGLVPWISKAFTGAKDPESAYDEPQAFYMLEEYLYLVIIVLSEPADMSGWSSARRIRREIVHGLCLGQCAYSDLLKRVSERFIDEADFDRILAEVANFRRPGGATDQGIYMLKDEYFDEVDPYYYRYNRNQHEEAEKALKDRLKERTREQNPVIVPKALEITRGPFVTIADAYLSETLVHILYSAITWACSPAKNPVEAVIDLALHLTMRGLVEKPRGFADLVVNTKLGESTDSTFARLLCRLVVDDRLKATKDKTLWCIERLAKEFPDAMSSIKIERPEFPREPSSTTSDDKKRQAAKARQAAIMQQFANAQKDFLANNFDEIEDADEDDLDSEPLPSLGSCIVCQEALNWSEPFGSLALIQSSRLVRMEVSEERLLREVLETPADLDVDASAVRPFGIAKGSREMAATASSSASTSSSSSSSSSSESPSQHPSMATAYPRRSRSGLHASACGHMMHVRCHETYVKSIEHRHQSQATRNHPENIERQEFICPLCKSLGNVLLPVAEVDSDGKAIGLQGESGESLDTWTAAVADASERRLSRKADGRLRAWKIDETIPTIPGHYPAQVTQNERTMAESFMRVLWPLTRETHQDNQARFVNDEVIAYTVAAIEISQRGTGQGAGADLAHSLSTPTLLLLRGLLHASRMLAMNGTPGGIPNARLMVANALVSRDNVNVTHSPMLLRDPLAILCDAASIAPEEFRQFVTLIFYAHLIRVFIALPSILAPVNAKSLVLPSAGGKHEAEFLELARLTKSAWGSAQPTKLEPWATVVAKLGDLALGKLIYSYTLPFLRRASVLAAAIGFTMAPTTNFEASELSRILKALKIPHPRDVLTTTTAGSSADVQVLHSLMESWHHRAATYCTLRPTGDLSSRLAAQTEHPAIYELVGLPVRLDTLISESLDRRCRRCNKAPMEPAICLLCGELVCYQSYCCMDQGEEEPVFGESNTHMWT